LRQAVVLKVLATILWFVFSDMGLESRAIWMAVHTMANGSTVKGQERELGFIQLELNMMECGKMIVYD